MIPAFTASKPPVAEGTKEKRTRRRLRVSCVECTKRRQKCDRQSPCGLCVSRGVSHLCRWESAPVARPLPVRPPRLDKPSPDHSESTPSSSTSTIDDLKARIDLLERTVMAQHSLLVRNDPSVADTNISSDTPHESQNTEPDVEGYSIDTASKNPLGRDVQEAAMALASLSLGTHHGEYVGRGTVVCALNDLGQHRDVQFSYATSTNASTYAQRQFPNSLIKSVQTLLHAIPEKSRTNTLIESYFLEVNWRFGVPEVWFHNALEEMWRTLSGPNASGMEINLHWLCLLFSMLALAPQEDTAFPFPHTYVESEHYFLHSLSARRLAQDCSFSTPSLSPLSSLADGTVLGCLATPLSCTYLAEIGRVSEAWKLLGESIRAAQAVGMHRDPGWEKWKIMSFDERLLRTTGWWGLVVWDRLYSFLLGRPTMIRDDVYDVIPPEESLPSNPTPYCQFQAQYVKLSDVVAEAVDKCLGIEMATFETVFQVDQKFVQWEAQMPEGFRWKCLQQSEPGSDENHEIVDLARRAWLLHTWYLACRMNLHRSYLTQVSMPSVKQKVKCSASIIGMKKSHELCIALAMDLICMQCVTHDSSKGRASRRENAAWMGNNWAFELCFFLFDGGVTLMSGFARMPIEARAKEAEELMQRAMEILESAAQEEGNGRTSKREVAMRAVDVLNVLGSELGWRQLPDRPFESSTSTAEPTIFSDPEAYVVDQNLPKPTSMSPGSWFRSFGHVPQPPAPVPPDPSNSTPWSMLFSPASGNPFSSSEQMSGMSWLNSELNGVVDGSENEGAVWPFP